MNSMARVLVIDDDADLRAIVRHVLEAKGFEVAVASHGVEGLEEMRRFVADIVITDIFMPEKEGMETIFEIRRRFPRVKIIAMSGSGHRPKAVDYLAVAFEAGADAILRKPFEGAQLIGALREVVK